MADEDASPGSGVYYLEAIDVLGVRAELLGLTGRQAADFLRNPSGLESALARPRTWAQYRAADLALQAAVLAHGVAEGQLFVDGNKRTALGSMRLFLALNGYTVSASQEERARWKLDLSRPGDAGELVEELADRVRGSLTHLGGP